MKKAGIKGKAGVDKLRIHDIRYFEVTDLARAGKDIKFTTQYLGHEHWNIGEVYRYFDKYLEEGSEIMAQVPSKLTIPTKQEKRECRK